MGGDHTIVLPVLRALAKRHGPLGCIHVDAHADVNDAMFGEPLAHGTPFRRAVAEQFRAYVEGAAPAHRQQSPGSVVEAQSGPRR